MRNYIFFSLFLISFGLVGCGNKTKGGAADSADSSAVVGMSAVVDDERHTEAYIKERIESIYRHFGYSETSRGPEAEGMPAVNYDSLYCSSRYLALLAEAEAISQREGTVCIDADHWIVGQDVDKKWSYELKDIRNITDSTAQEELLVNNFGPQKVVLDLLFEHGEWYVDNFRQTYDASSLEGEEGEVFLSSEVLKEISEVDELREYINMSKEDREESKQLAGEWGWVGDDCPELLLTLVTNDGYLAVKECLIYRLASFNDATASYHYKTLEVHGFVDYVTDINLSVSLDENGDLTGTCKLNLDEYNIFYEGPITLRKNYFRYK